MLSNLFLLQYIRLLQNMSTTALALDWITRFRLDTQLRDSYFGLDWYRKSFNLRFQHFPVPISTKIQTLNFVFISILYSLRASTLSIYYSSKTTTASHLEWEPITSSSSLRRYIAFKVIKSGCDFCFLFLFGSFTFVWWSVRPCAFQIHLQWV